MRIVFAGTPEFARQALVALLDAGHHIPLVLTQPDRKAGRGLHKSLGPVKALALERGLALCQPEKLTDPAIDAALQSASPDVLVVAAYGLILPQSVLTLAPRGAFNIHASLLPRWRGAAPIQRAILAGDPATGVTIMQMDAGLDTGPMLDRRRVAISPDETAQSLHDKLALLGAEMIVKVLRQAESGNLPATPQPTDGVTYAHKTDKRETGVDWRKSAVELDRMVRAFNPSPGAHAVISTAEIKKWRASMLNVQREAGRVHAVDPEGVVVTCGEGALRITELQRSGGKRLAVRAFLSGYPIAPGSRFALPA